VAGRRCCSSYENEIEIPHTTWVIHRVSWNSKFSYLSHPYLNDQRIIKLLMIFSVLTTLPMFQVDEKGLWWPGKLVTEAEVPADFHKLLALSEGIKKRLVSLFNPAKEFDPYQAVTRRWTFVLSFTSRG
jgi:hypothetical protein